MDLRALFAFFVIFAVGFGIDIGDSFNEIYNTVKENDGGNGWVLSAVPMIGLGIFGFHLYFTGKEDRCPNSYDAFWYALAPTCAAAGFSSLYGFFVGPIWKMSENPWVFLDGWLALVIVGLIPLILTINDLIVEKAEREAHTPR